MLGATSMSEPPFPDTECKAGSRNVDQTRNGGSCAIMNFDQDFTFVWLKVHLSRRFNVANTILYLRNKKEMLYRVFHLKKKMLLVQLI